MNLTSIYRRVRSLRFSGQDWPWSRLKNDVLLGGNSLHIKLCLPQAAQEFCNGKISCVAPPRGTCLRTLYWEKEDRNKCRPILVQGLRREIEINFHIINIYGSVAQRISAWLWIWRTPVWLPVRDIFFTYISFKEEMNQEQQQQQEQVSTNTGPRSAARYFFFFFYSSQSSRLPQVSPLGWRG